MTPAQFLSRLKRGEIAPAYLMLGAEAYERRKCREALIAAHLGDETFEQGLVRYDLTRSSLTEVIDDARAMSLFALRRLLVITEAEAALPKTGKTTADGEEDEAGSAPGGGDLLGHYLNDPSPGVSLLFEAVRFDFEGDDKKRIERVRKFYSPISHTIELKRFSTDEARAEVQAIARRGKFAIEPAAAEQLVEALGGEMGRIANELEKLALYATPGKAITIEDIGALVPEARATTIFVLVSALGRRDRARALEALDTLCRDGEYLPLALAFLSGQFRMALAAREAGLRGPQQIQSYFQKQGMPVWGTRAEQIAQTIAKFTKEQIVRGLQLMFETDRDFRSAAPDDRIVMERFVMKLTA